MIPLPFLRAIKLYAVLIFTIMLLLPFVAQARDFTPVNTAIILASLENEIISIRRKELEAEAWIERLKIDIQVVEKKWHAARVGDTESRLLLDSISRSHLQTKVLWQQLNTDRTDLENTSLLLEWYRRHRMILRSILSASRDTEMKIDLWRAVIDSVKPLENDIDEEYRWRKERLVETRFDIAALDTMLSDAILPRDDRFLIQKRKKILMNKATSDSILTDAGYQIDSMLAGYRISAKDALKQITIRQQTRRLFRRILGVWSYKIHDFDGKPLTVGKIIFALFIIVTGLKLAQIVSKLLALVVKRRSQLDSGIVDAGQKLFFYTFAALFTLYALHSVQVPLTAFTVIGGALALGFGFGSQNVVSNLISGIILLVERPVKGGDFIEIESSVGIVETIGLRSVRIRTQGNEHLIIPNSYLLEKPLINWTFSDKIIRLELAVGVIYGSPIREVKRLLLAAATNIDRINVKPEPFVILSDFGDNALLFHLVFWSRINSIIEKRMILSQLRFKVVDLFDQAHIVIAFPQRDVHLDTTSALKIRIENESPAPTVERINGQKSE